MGGITLSEQKQRRNEGDKGEEDEGMGREEEEKTEVEMQNKLINLTNKTKNYLLLKSQCQKKRNR